MNERYYLICVPDHAPNTRLYRIDRMKDIQILDDPRSEAVARQEAQNAVYAYVGAPERIIMYCDRAILDDVIDRFGTEVQIREHDENTFTASSFKERLTLIMPSSRKNLRISPDIIGTA